MASTNKTDKLELSQFLGSDIPDWLQDYNSDMRKIDTGVSQTQAELQALEGEKADVAATICPNLIDNGGFQIWQRGTQFSLTGSGTDYTADRFYVSHEGPVTVEMASGLTFTSTGTAQEAAMVGQRVEIPEDLLGKTVTVSFEAASQSTQAVSLIGYNGTGTGAQIFSHQYSLTADFQRITHTFQMPASLSGGVLNLVFLKTTAQNVQFWLRKAKLEEGSAFTGFAFYNKSQELIRCQRYYVPIWKETRLHVVSYTANNLEFYYQFPAAMRGRPTFVYPNPGIIKPGTQNTDTNWEWSYYYPPSPAALNGVLIRATRENHGWTNGFLRLNDGTYFTCEI